MALEATTIAMDRPRLRFLHPPDSLSDVKLAPLRRWSNEALTTSLQPGRPDSLKTRRDGTVLDGHHRLFVLNERGVEIDALPREIIEKVE